MEKCNPIDTPLSGTTLIEAGAGTGKTYTLTGLFIRLILEEGIPADRILVVTFTTAATEELKQRIRQKLLGAQQAFLTGNSDDAILQALLDKKLDNQLALKKIHDAIVDFDKTAVFTIHGFCHRVLCDHVFETGGLFDTELTSDQSTIIGEFAEDFWRTELSSAPREFVQYVLSKLGHPDHLAGLLSRHFIPGIRVLPQIMDAPLSSLGEFRKLFKELQAKWPDQRAAVLERLSTDDLKANIYGNTEPSQYPGSPTHRDIKLKSIADQMDRYTHRNSIGFPIFDGFNYFATVKIRSSTKKGKQPPLHPFYDICERLAQIGDHLQSQMDHRLLMLKSALFSRYPGAIAQKKQKSNVMFFDDLLLSLHRVVSSEKHRQLTDSVRNTYHAVLVDEFQDTDTVQYDIFKRLFSDRRALFFIGDPKQAIYGFRGADVFTYIKASHDAERKCTLLTNWRSNPGLITAVNTIFSNNNRPFVIDGISFEPADSARTEIGETGDTEQPADITPLTLWFLDSPPESSSKRQFLHNKVEATRKIAEAVVAEVGRLVGKTQSPIRPEQIAILVRTNAQAHLMKNLLTQYRIPAVQYSFENVFSTPDALEMAYVLAALAEPLNDRLVKRALATGLMGFNAEDLFETPSSIRSLESWYLKFKQCLSDWEHRGFIPMFRSLLVDATVRDRLLSLPDGERRITNILHLAELIDQAAREYDLGAGGTVKWLEEQRRQALISSDSSVLRLESDDSAVKIVTIHKSKGLEYDVVFCPFSWESSFLTAESAIFHDPGREYQLTLDLALKSNPDHKRIAQNELLAENLRLLYVALTRARKQCYLVWGRINTADSSALAYLLYAQDAANDTITDHDIPAMLKKRLSAMSAEEFSETLDRLAARSKGTIRVSPLPDKTGIQQFFTPPPVEALSYRPFSGPVESSWAVTSYSALVSGGAGFTSLERPATDRDALSPRTLDEREEIHSGPDVPVLDISTFPKGARAGNFFHDILEFVDYRPEGAPERDAMVTSKLQTYGFDAKWKTMVSEALENILASSLPLADGSMRLSELDREHRINELAFHFPISRLTPSLMQNVFGRHPHGTGLDNFSESLGRLMFSPTQGFLKGYIDLVFIHDDRFYIVDWKTNHLGHHPNAYAGNRLAGVMHDELYILQYHLYSLALHRYLGQRIVDYAYDAHFGGVFYLFLRGMRSNAEKFPGIYFDRPPRELIKELENTILIKT